MTRTDQIKAEFLRRLELKRAEYDDEDYTHFSFDAYFRTGHIKPRRVAIGKFTEDDVVKST